MNMTATGFASRCPAASVNLGAVLVEAAATVVAVATVVVVATAVAAAAALVEDMVVAWALREVLEEVSHVYSVRQDVTIDRAPYSSFLESYGRSRPEINVGVLVVEAAYPEPSRLRLIVSSIIAKTQSPVVYDSGHAHSSRSSVLRFNWFLLPVMR